MQSRGRSSSIGDSASSYALPGRGVVANQAAERKSTFIRSRSNSVGDDRSYRSSCDLIAAYSLGLTQESLFKHIPHHANVALSLRPNVRERRSSSVSDCEPNHARRLKSTSEEPTRASALRRSPNDAKQTLRETGEEKDQPSTSTKPSKESSKNPIVPTLILQEDSPGRPSRSSTEPALGSVLPQLSFRSTSSIFSSTDSLESLTSGGSTVGLSPRLLQLSHQMSRAYFLEFILHDKKARQAFKGYLEKRHCVENLMFWLDVERFKKLVKKNVDGAHTKEVIEKVEEIREKYLQPSSVHEVNLTHQDRKELIEALKNPDVNSFDRAQKAIFVLMIDGTFDYFLKSDSYKQMQNADDMSTPRSPHPDVSSKDKGKKEGKGKGKRDEPSKEEKDAAKRRRSLFGRRNTDAPQPPLDLGASEVEVTLARKKNSKRRHTLADSNEMGVHPGADKKCLVM